MSYQEDEVLSLHNLQQLDDAAMSQPPQDADLPLNAPLIHCLLQDHPVTWLTIQSPHEHHVPGCFGTSSPKDSTCQMFVVTLDNDTLVTV